MSILLIIGFVVSIFVILLIFRKKEYGIQQKFAISIFTIWALRFLLYYIKNTYNLSFFPLLYILDQSFFFLDGPLLLLYTRSLGKNAMYFKTTWYHFILFAIALSITLFTYANVPDSYLSEIYQETSEDADISNFTPNIFEVIFIIFIIITNIFYAIFSIKEVRSHKKKLTNNLSTIAQASVGWLLKFIKVWILLLALPIAIYFINYIYPVVSFDYLEILLIFSLVASAFYFGINLVEQKYVSFVSIADDSSKLKEPDTPDKDEKNLSTKEKQAFEKVLSHVQTNKPYLDVELTLHSLAQQLNLKPNKLSYLINNNSNGNFHDFINGYRIEAIKRDLLATNEQIILIAYDNGFNSKSTFNQVFKKLTGTTPSQYRRNHKA